MKFKTMRHIETVRNYLNTVIKELLYRQEQHDQSKMQEPEAAIFEEYTPKLRDVTYGSELYNQYLKEMQVALDHHYSNNRHHPEFFSLTVADDFAYWEDGKRTLLSCMTLIDLIEMLCDWKAGALRHADGDIFKSININQSRFGYSDELKQVLINTVKWINKQNTYHKADES